MFRGAVWMLLPTLVTLLVVVIKSTMVFGCVFDCATNSTCDGGELYYIERTYQLQSVNAAGVITVSTSPMRYVLNLEGRGITSIAPNGLDCYIDAYTALGYSIQGYAVSLDDNLLTQLPDLSVFRGAPTISIQNNSIQSLSPLSLTNFATTDFLIIYLDFNQIESLPEGVFRGCPAHDIFISLKNNHVANISQGAFAISSNTQLAVYLQHNRVTSINDRVFAGSNCTDLVVFLQNNTVATLEANTFSDFNGRQLNVFLDSNKVTSVAAGAFTLPGSKILMVSLQYNMIELLRTNTFSNFDGTQLSVFLRSNTISQIEAGAFAKYYGAILFVYLDYNKLERLDAFTFAGFSGNGLELHIKNNLITSIANDTFSGFNTDFLAVWMENNEIVSLGHMFRGFIGTGLCQLSLANNTIGIEAMHTAISSFTSSGASLIIDFQYNNISGMPANLLNNVAVNTSHGVFSALDFDFRYNPINSIDSHVFNGTAFLQSISMDLSHRVVNTSLPASTQQLQTPDVFTYGGLVWNPQAESVLNLSFANTSAKLSVVRALSSQNTATTLNIDLSFNTYTEISAGEFHGCDVTALNLSNTEITSISADAFTYTFTLGTLDVSHNTITMIPIDLMSNTPVLAKLRLVNNKVWALPIVSNHIASTVDVDNDNIIVCGAYGPNLTHCGCNDGLEYSEHCGYGRCLPTYSGCLATQLPDIQNCSLSPYSVCMSTCRDGTFYDNTAQACLPISNCTLAFVDDDGTPILAYQFLNYTATSNRLCSICSTCPAGFQVTTCTTTSNTRCTQVQRLSSGDVASIVLAAVILAVTAGLGVWYGRSELTKRALTQGELEMTELLLGDVTVEKDRITQENLRMQQAWIIDESDLNLGDVIGRGAFGTVFSGTWGHIPVAVKVLRIPLDDLDPLMSEDFDREVTFMQSIRHPNLLTFYGAGVNTNSQAFLVTELMSEGSLRTLLLNLQLVYSWDQRLSFVVDVARGMKYLHEKDTLHRDLKADNCFVDAHGRVKVADFGTGKLQSTFAQVKNKQQVSASMTPDLNRTLTKGSGTLLWMAPEVLRGDKILAANGAAIDVYSFGVVMWEIWARARPWDEIPGEGIEFISKLEQLVSNGQRPRLPRDCEDAPAGYSTVMNACWRNFATERPSFAIILDDLTTISPQK